VSPKLAEIFHEAYRELRPRTPAPPMPPMDVRFYPFVSINNTIRLRQGKLYIRLSDLLEGAPEAVQYSIAHILLAKLYRQPVDRIHSARYRRYVASHDVAAKARLVRQMRGRKHIHSARGHHYHLEEIFDDLNRRFFHGLMGRPQLTWSQNHARSSLGHYDPAHNAIVISRVFDSPRVPRYAVEYILFHEMLHLKHPVKLRGSRRCVHSREFLAEEKMFPELAQAKNFLRII
jgi:predicted metal-dependent hydrolase